MPRLQVGDHQSELAATQTALKGSGRTTQPPRARATLSATDATPTDAVKPGLGRVLFARMRAVARACLQITSTSAFRLASAYVAAAVVVGAIVMWSLFEATNAIISQQVAETLSVEADGLAAIARSGGRQAAITAVAHKVRDAAAAAPAGPQRLYLLEDASGARLVGNLSTWPPELNRTSTAGGLFAYTAPVENGTRRLAVGLSSQIGPGLRLLVARDLEPQRRLATRVRWLFLGGFGALALIGLLAGLLISRVALSRLSQITRTTDSIMAGDFTGRIPVSDTDDELDHLARNLNAMLDRIEQLMAGLREVSDNIAHDLKTPLSRLRARAEAALREGGAPEQYRDSLGSVIEDADELIKTFNALLLIARLEAGSVDDTAEPIEVAQLAEDVAELYRPVAEEAGLRLRCRGDAGAVARANRQLVGQAIANMIDNAIKYAGSATAGSWRGEVDSDGPADIEVRVDADDTDVTVSVADRGPGIPEADRERVLKRFVRLEASRTRPGTGLGLSLVAAVARLHGGRVSLADNAPGLRVNLALPRQLKPYPEAVRDHGRQQN